MASITFLDKLLSHPIRRCWHDDQGGMAAENGFMFAGVALAVIGLIYAAGGDFSIFFRMFFGG